MKRMISMLALSGLLLAACSSQPADPDGAPPAAARVNAVRQVDADTGTATLNVSALDDSGSAIQGNISDVSASITSSTLGTLQNLSVTASVCQQIVVHGAIHGVLSLDGSGSMDWNDPDEHRNDAAKTFVDRLTAGAQLAVASFPGGPAPGQYTLHQDFTDNKALLYAAVDEATFKSGGTPLWTSSTHLITEHLDSADDNKVLVVMTDGEDFTASGPDNLINAADANGVRVYFVGLGDAVSEAEMIRVADATNGLYGHAEDSTELSELFNGMLQAATASGEICLTFSPNPVPAGTVVEGVVTLTIGGRDFDASFQVDF